MRKCKTCGIISHPHKDFYKCFDKRNSSSVCKYCFPVVRSLKANGIIPFKENGVKYSLHYRSLIVDGVKSRLKNKSSVKIKSLKREILKRLDNNYALLKCSKCKIWHKREDLPSYLKERNQTTCHKCWKQSSLNWVNNNKERANKRSVEYIKKRLKEDSFFKFQMSIRSLIAFSIKNKGYTRKSRATQILGCDWETFKLHIEKQFKKGMTWENRSEWHIDHIYPMKEAKTEEDVIRLNHYTNLRPLWAKENLSKNASIEEHQMKLPI